MLFYAALHLQAETESTKVPLLDIEVSRAIVLSSGPVILALLVLAIAGSMRALRRAREAAPVSLAQEEFDFHPNLIDLAFYAPPESHPLFSPLARSVYAVFLSLGLIEGVWLGQHICDSRLPTTYIVVVVVLGACFWLRAAWLVGDYLWRRCFHDFCYAWQRGRRR
jgi:hypothetical protein